MIDSGRFINDSMGRYIGKQTVKKIIAAGKNLKGARVLIMGMTLRKMLPTYAIQKLWML